MAKLNSHWTAVFANHSAFDETKRVEFKKLLTQYEDLESKRAVIIQAAAPKISKKERLLSLKNKTTHSKLDELEIENLTSLERADTVRDELLATSEKTYNASLKAAEKTYQESLKAAAEHQQKTIDFAHKQHTKMIDRSQRLFDSKKKILERREEYVKEELSIVSDHKTAPEHTIDRQQNQLLLEMQRIIQAVEYSRKGEDCQKYIDKLGPIPVLPKPLPESSKPPTPLQTPPVKQPFVETDWLTAEEKELQKLREEEQFKFNTRQKMEEQARLRRREEQHNEYLASKQRQEELEAKVKKELEAEGIHTPKPVEEPVEDEESEIDDDQLARDIEEAKQRQRHILLRLPKKPVKVIKKSGPTL